MSRIHEALQKAELERQKGRDPKTGRTAGETCRPRSRIPIPAPRHGLSQSASKVGIEGPASEVSSPESGVPVRWKLDPSKLLFAGQSPSSLGVEAFRTLRTRLYLLRKQRPLQKIMVTSPFSQDGKTFVSANLGQALAQQGDRVLLIDADLRFSTLHALFGAPSAPGLTEYLKGECSEDTIVQKGSIENLFFVPGGKHVDKATELLANGRLEELLLRLSGDFDWFVLDSPPVIPVSDAKIIGELCEGALIVVRSDSTTLSGAQKTCREIGSASLLGIVLNRVNPKVLRGSSYYYGKGKSANS